MSTRCQIILEGADVVIYRHSDGYPDTKHGVVAALKKIEEHARFQELKSLAVANGLLSLEEGQTLYIALGESPSVFNGQPIEVKAILTGIFKELLGASIKAKGGKLPARKRR